LERFRILPLDYSIIQVPQKNVKNYYKFSTDYDKILTALKPQPCQGAIDLFTSSYRLAIDHKQDSIFSCIPFASEISETVLILPAIKPSASRIGVLRKHQLMNRLSAVADLPEQLAFRLPIPTETWQKN